MKERRFRANSTDIHKAPDRVRYVFILELKRGSVTVITTYNSLAGAVLNNIVKITVVDLKNSLVNEVSRNVLGDLIEEWRENYFNYDWDIPMQMLKLNF